MSVGTLTLVQAAMFAALGQQTKLSRAGHSVVFVEPQCGRHDLSDDEGRAAAQARSAGLDIDSVTAEQVEAYQSWHSAMYEARRVGDARIQITAPYVMQHRNELVPVNGVRLIDGWGCVVSSRAVRMEMYLDPARKNRIGELGAYCHRPDYVKITARVKKILAKYPEFANARLQDNNHRGRK